MKTTDEIVADIPDACDFFTFDVMNGFMQIKLIEASSFRKAFNTLIGKYCWPRLLFRISCVPEVYQCIMNQMLEGLPGYR